MKLMIFAFLFIWNCGSVWLSARVSEKPDVLFIAVDDLNDMVDFLNGHPGTKNPHMGRLVREGVLFNKAHCTAPWCNPSRASIMLGQYPATTGIYSNGHNWRRYRDKNELKTLPEAFEDNGYKVLGGGKLYHSYA